MDKNNIEKLKIAMKKVQEKGYKIDSSATRGRIMNISKPNRKYVEDEIDKQISYVLANKK